MGFTEVFFFMEIKGPAEEKAHRTPRKETVDQ